MSTINNGATLFEDVTGLEKFTEYEFQVLAFTSDGDGPKSSVKVERTKEDGKRRKAVTTEAAIQITLHVYVKGFWEISQHMLFQTCDNIQITCKMPTQN